MPTRVTFVVWGFGVGGLERCVARLCNGLDRKRYLPSVVCLSTSGPAAAWITAEDVEVVELRKPPRNDPRVVMRLARALRRLGTDVVHSHNWGTLLEAALAAGLVRIPHVHAERGMHFDDEALGGWKRALRHGVKRRALLSADALVAVAPSVREHLERTCRIPSDRVTVIPNGIEAPAGADDEGARERIRDRLGIGPAAHVIGSVGRLAPVKSFQTAIDATAALLERERDAHLVLVGDGPEKARLAEHACRAGLEGRVHLVGAQEAVGAWMRAFDVYVNCSLSEGMSQSLLEAMACGLAPVVTDVGESRLVVAESGIVVSPGDPAALAAALDGVVGDPVLRQELGAMAVARQRECFATATMIRAYEALYQEVLQSGRRARSKRGRRVPDDARAEPLPRTP